MTKIILRPNKYGGVSPCRSPEDKVGKGRCTHILEEADSVQLIYNKDDRCYYVDISNNKGEKLSVAAQEKQIEAFIKTIEETIDNKTKKKIVEFLRKRR